MNRQSKRNRLGLWQALLALFATLSLFSSAQAQPSYHLGTTRKLFQLTNDWDFALRKWTRTKTPSNTAIGTDLGSSFMHNGKLWFTFGDTLGASVLANGDMLGYTDATRPGDMNNLVLKTNTNGTLRPISIPGVSTGGMEVPSCAISIAGNIYVVQTTAWNGTNMGKSVLARSTDSGTNYTNLYTLSDGTANINNAHFINVSLRVANASTFPVGTLPWSSGDILFIWGAGAYRNSNLYLAAIPVSSIGTKSAMRYVSGVNGSNVPTWSTSELSAVPVVTQPHFGEFSCTWIPQQGRWLLMYNSPAYGGATRGIQMRTATQPWGSWSAPQTVMDPDRDQAYGQYMHISWSAAGHYDKIQDYILAGDNDWGGEYGGYVVEPWTTGDATNTQIYWVMSTWNPYQSILMNSEIGAPVVSPEPADSGTQTIAVGDASWNKTSTTFYGSLGSVGGIPGITTWTGSDATTGVMWKALPADRWNKRLTFNVTSGNGEVILIDGTAPIPTTGSPATIRDNIKNGLYGEVLRATWGHESNDIVVPINWDLTPYDRANLRVIVTDYSTAGWSFVGVSNMTLTRNQPSVGTNGSTIQPGDSSWTKTAGSWFNTWTDTGVNYLTTFGPSGDANVGVMWRMLPRDWKNKTLSFSYHGGHGRIYLLQGGDPIPTSGTFSIIQGDIANGKYGRVLKTIVGADNNTNVPVTWNLEQLKSDDLKLVVVDSLNEPWGFIGFSQMSLTRYN